MKIKNWYPLQVDWQPPVIHFRESHLKEMERATSYKGAKEHIFCSGGKGVGKSATTLTFANNFREQTGGSVLFIKCLRSFTDTFNEAFPDLPHRERQWSWWQSYKDKELLIIFDDVSVFERPTIFGTYLTTLYDGLHRYGCHDFSVFLTSTIPLMMLDTRYWTPTTMSRFGFQALSFEPYSKEELYDIAMERLHFATSESEKVVESSFTTKDGLDLLIDHVYRHGSDVRLLLRLLEKSSKRMIMKGAPRLNVDIAQEAWDQEKRAYWVDTFSQMLPHKGFLLYCYFFLRNKRGKVLSSDIYAFYKQTCEKRHIRPLKDRMLFNYIRDLETEHFIRTDVRNDRTGRTMEIESDLQPDMMVGAGQEINWEERLR